MQGGKINPQVFLNIYEDEHFVLVIPFKLLQIMFELVVILLLINKLDKDENMLLVKLNGINSAKSWQS